MNKSFLNIKRATKVFGAIIAVVCACNVNAGLIQTDRSAIDNANKIFTSELKVDHNLFTNSSVGSDLFLREGNNTLGPNAVIDWGNVSDMNVFTANLLVVYSLTGNNTQVTVRQNISGADPILGSLTGTSLSSQWDAVEFWIRPLGRDDMFTDVSMVVRSTEFNTLFPKDAGNSYIFERDASTSSIDTLAVNIQLSWTLNPNYSGTNKSPNGNLQFSMKAFEFDTPNATVNAPATLGLMAILGAVLFARKRNSK